MSFYDNADEDDDDDEYGDQPLPRKRSKLGSKAAGAAQPPKLKPSIKPTKPVVHVEHVDDSSSGDDAQSSKTAPARKRRVQYQSDPHANALQLATIQLLTNLNKTTEPAVLPKPKEVPVGAKPDQVGGAIPRVSKANCFYCTESFQDLRDHNCQQRKDKILTCLHCKLPVKAKNLPGLFEHMYKCDRRSCGKCKSKTHSFYFCPTFQCFTCKKYGHSRILHKWGTEGAALIALHSADEPGQ